jgi:kinesin family member 11
MLITIFLLKKSLIQELSRNLERSKSVSTTAVNFYRTIDAHTLELMKILEESQSAHQKQLFQLQKKFEVTTFTKVAFL